MTSPFGAPIVAGAEPEGGPKFLTPHVSNIPLIVFVDWRIPHWPTERTQAGKEAEVLGVTVVNLGDTIQRDLSKVEDGSQVVTIETGQIIPGVFIRQVWLIKALKPRLGSFPALGMIQMTFPGGPREPAKYEWVDLQDNPEIMARGLAWMEANPNPTRSEKPDYTPPTPQAAAVQRDQAAQQAWGQAQAPQGYGQQPQGPYGQQWAPPAQYQQGVTMTSGGYPPQPQYVPQGPPPQFSTPNMPTHPAPAYQQAPQPQMPPQGPYGQPNAAWNPTAGGQMPAQQYPPQGFPPPQPPAQTQGMLTPDQLAAHQAQLRPPASAEDMRNGQQPPAPPSMQW